MRPADGVAGRERAGAQHVDEVGVGIVAAADPAARRRRRAPDAGRAARRADVAAARPARRRRRARSSRRASDRQDAVGLAAAAQRRQRAARADVAAGVVADPVAAASVSVGVAADHLGRGSSPRSPATARSHRRRRAARRRRRRRRAPERRVDRPAARPRAAPRRPASVARPRSAGRAGHSRAKLCSPRRIAAGEAGALVGGVVGRRAGRQEGQPVGVVVGVEQGGEPLGPARPRRSDPATSRTSTAASTERLGQRQPQRHADLLGPVEVDHPAHAVVDRRASGRRQRGRAASSRSGPTARSAAMSRPVATASTRPPRVGAWRSSASGRPAARGVRTFAAGSPRSGNRGSRGERVVRPDGCRRPVCGVGRLSAGRSRRPARGRTGRPASARRRAAAASSAAGAPCSSQ